MFKRIVDWGDGWLPVIREIPQLIDGRAQLQQLCEEAHRDPATIRITVFGAVEQWRQRKKLDALAAAGAEHVTLWLRGNTSAEMQSEMDILAKELLQT